MPPDAKEDVAPADDETLCTTLGRALSHAHAVAVCGGADADEVLRDALAMSGYVVLQTMASDAQLEALARAILSTEEGQLMMICHGPAPCMPTPCSCTRNIYPVARAAYTAIIAQREGS